ncbi:MAG: shikimate kinase [Ilumatobacteraceae bacterium]
MSDRKVVLVGMMGSGKSSAGRRLAKALNIDFIDLDQSIEARSGRSIRDIFSSGGEAEFRDLEEAELRRTLDEPGAAVIAAGGGIVVRAAARDLLARAHDVIWLRADVDVLAERVSRGRGHRPLVDGDPKVRLGALLEEREDHYRSVATAVVEVDDCSLEDVVKRIESLVSTTSDRGVVES